MDATLADRSPVKSATPSWGPLLLETLILTAVMAAPYFLFGYAWGLAGVCLVGLGYIAWGVLLETRDSRGFEEPPTRVLLLVLAITFIGGGIPVLLFMIGAQAWSLLAYSFEVTQWLAGLREYYLWRIPVFVLAPPVLILAVIAWRPAREGVATTELGAAIRRKGFAPFANAWMSYATLAGAIICFTSFSATVPATQPLLESLYLHETPSVWDHAATYPVLPIALIGGTAMLVVFRRLESCGVSPACIVQAYAGPRGDSPAPVSRGYLAVVACGWIATLYVTVYPIHLGLVAALSSVAGIPATVITADIIDEWAEARSEEGLTGAELAVILNEYGSWNPQAPEAGLPSLFAGLRENMPAGNDTGTAACSITIAAAATDPAAVRDIDWLTPGQSGSDLKYCIRTACPSPVAWDAPDTVMLASSHSSRNEQWMNFIFIDIFAEGRVPAPGGYCTADGGLADEFQG